LCTIVATSFMLIARGIPAKMMVKFVLSIALVTVAIVHVMPKEVVEKAMSTKKFNSNEIRMRLWSEIYPLLIKKPLRAVGWGNALVIGDQVYMDVANVVLFDWMQMSIFGALALISVIVSAIHLTLNNARRMPKNTYLAFVNLIALGIICTRFMHGMLDTFWIGRGCNLATWMAIGLAVYVKLLLDQKDQMRRINNHAVSKTRVPQKIAA
jgi:hypothetical protein